MLADLCTGNNDVVKGKSEPSGTSLPPCGDSSVQFSDVGVPGDGLKAGLTWHLFSQKCHVSSAVTGAASKWAQ